MANKKEYSEVIQCRHCGNTAPMETAAKFSHVRLTGVEYDDGSPDLTQVSDNYEGLLCQSCHKPTLRHYFWHDGWMETAEDTTITIIYPAEERAPAGLPPAIARELSAAEAVRTISPSAFGVLMGRAVDLVLADRGAIGDTQDKKLRNLAAKGEIPAQLAEVAARLRRLRNIGAHADLGELTEQDIPVLRDLAHALLEYIYSAPLLVQRAEERLSELNARSPERRTKHGEQEKSARPADHRPSNE